MVEAAGTDQAVLEDIVQMAVRTYRWFFLLTTSEDGSQDLGLF